RRCEEPVEVIQRQLERGGPQGKELSPQLLDAAVVCEQRLLEVWQILRPDIHACAALIIGHAEAAGTTLAIDGELGHEIRFGVRYDVDIAMLIAIFGTGLITGFETARIKIGNFPLDLDRQGMKAPRLRENTLDELLRDSMALQVEKPDG